ncbi:MAG: sialate O-acetylesterase [Planctomycetota bacterium]
MQSDPRRTAKGALLLALAAPGALAAPQNSSTEPLALRVFLVAGQSNAEGLDAEASDVDSIPAYVGSAAPQEGVRFWYETDAAPLSSNGWIDLQPELQRGIFGPELTFGRRLSESISAPLAIIKSTRGGTSLAIDWAPDATTGDQMYQRTLTLVQSALASLDAEGVAWELAGVLWQQGSNDMLNPTFAAAYGANLAALIERLRSDLSEPDLAWYVGALSDKSIWGVDGARANMQILREQQLQVVAADPRVHFVPTSHLAFKFNVPQLKPHFHFGTEGTLQLGEAHADAYLESIGQPNEHASAALCCGLPASGSKVRVFVFGGHRSGEGERAYASQIADHPAFAALAEPLHAVPYRYRLGGGMHTASDWAPLGPTDYLDNFGPELSFGSALDAQSSAPIAVIKVTQSGAILEDWVPGSTNASLPQYDASVAFIQEALDDLVDNGLDPQLEAVVWTPAAADAWWQPHTDNYAANLQALAAAMRGDLQAPDLKWLVAELADGLVWQTDQLDGLDAEIQAVAAADPQLWFVPTGSIAAPALSPTFGTAGTLELGQRLAEFYLGLASATAYGSGKAGTQGVPELSIDAPPVLGTSADLRVQRGNPGNAPVILLGQQPLELPFDGGTLLVDSIYTLGLPAFDLLGNSSLSIPLPDTPALVGEAFFAQSVFIDTGGGASGLFQTALSAGLELRLGYE